MLNDPLVQAFETATIDPAAFHHREHLYVAWCYLRVLPVEDALARYVRHLRLLTSALGANPQKLRATRAIDKDRWVHILRSAGLDDDAMHRWHIEFERMAPQAHRDFLESLGLSKAEVSRIRRWSSVPAESRPQPS